MRRLLLPAVLALSSCQPLFPGDCDASRKPGRVAPTRISQGVAGDLWVEDPRRVRGCPSGRILPARRTVYVYPPTTSAQAVRSPAHPSLFRPTTHPLDSTRSDANGHYELSLPPGRYSVFVREGADLYAEAGVPRDTALGMELVEVAPGRVTQRPIHLIAAAPL